MPPEEIDMLENILAGIASIFAPGPLLGIALGTTVGLLFGAIPGISGIMAIAILLPMTFYVSPLIGIPMLLGIYKASIYGGSISAILLNTPGAPPAVCTTMDGYPLAQSGRPRLALDISLKASVFGDIASALLLIFVAAPLSGITLHAGPAEQFSLIVLALTVVGTVSGPSLIKGILCCCAGIMLSTIGISETTGATRFVFGFDGLVSGISLIPMIIGLLCLPEIMHQVSICAGKQIREVFSFRSTGEDRSLSLREFVALLPVLLKSSAIGSFLGAMPGIGSSPAAFMAYSEAKRSSKSPEKFGTGVYEGIAAPECANNAVTGSAMIPMLTLGIPGDDVTAILMGAFMIQGIAPGPTIFHDHTMLIYGIYAGLIMCDVFLFFIAKGGFRFWIKLSQAPKHIIFSAVTVFCFVGAYTINQNMFDLATLIVFGIVGYYFRRFDFSPAAFIIGFILGPLWERTFDQVLVLFEGDISVIFTRPFSAGLLALALITGISIAYNRRRNNQRLAQIGMYND